MSSVSLCKDSQMQCFSIHYLVLLAFIGPRPPGYVCNHIDANRANNAVQNLEWVTEHRNNQHALETGRICVGERCYKAKLTAQDVRTIRREAAKGVYYIVLARRFGVSRGTIKRVVRRQSWKHL